MRIVNKCVCIFVGIVCVSGSGEGERVLLTAKRHPSTSCLSPVHSPRRNKMAIHTKELTDG